MNEEARCLPYAGGRRSPHRQPATTNMVKPEDITAVVMTLKVDEELSLFALLAAVGSINRLGTGTIKKHREGHVYWCHK